MDSKTKEYVEWVIRNCEIREPILEIGAGWMPNYYRSLFGDRLYLTQDIRDYEKDHGVRIDVVCDAADMRNAVKDASVGTVLCLNTLEHVPSPQRIVDEILRVLLPEGRVVITVPTRCPIHREPMDYWRFMPDGVIHLLRRFEIQDLTVGRSLSFPSCINTTAVKPSASGGPEAFDLSRIRLKRENSVLVNTVQRNHGDLQSATHPIEVALGIRMCDVQVNGGSTKNTRVAKIFRQGVVFARCLVPIGANHGLSTELIQRLACPALST